MSDESGRAIKQGAVLYDTRGNTSLEPVSERGLCHVVSVYEELDTGDRLFNVWDGTHTYQEFVHEERILEDFMPAGWTFSPGKKPLYHLTRNCGLEDPADLMTDGGEPPESTDEGKHFVRVRAVHVLRGGFDASFLKEDNGLKGGAEDLEHHEEKSLSFECSCGERFLKWDTAEEHLREVVSRGE